MRSARTRKLSLGEAHATGLKYKREGEKDFYRFGEDGENPSTADMLAMDYEVEPQPAITDIWHIPLKTGTDYLKLKKGDNDVEVVIKVVRKQLPNGTAVFTASVDEEPRNLTPVKRRGRRKSSK